MKNLFLLLITTIAFHQLKGQVSGFTLKKSSKGSYVEHTVAPKEGLYSIGRAYNVHPKHIAGFNNIDLNKGLNIGQTIQIPLTDTNFNQKSKKGTPVYYEVGQNENLVKVSNANNKVLLKDLRAWNSLSNDNPTAGSKLIVGFLNTTQVPPVNTTAAKQPEVKKEETAANKNDKPAVKTEPPVEKAVVKDKSVTEQGPKAEPVRAPEVKAPEVVAEKRETPQKNDAVFTRQDVGSVGPEQGYFKKSFEQQVKSSPASKNNTVTSGIFKTTSGWQDGKYYLLIDGVATGTIVKIINPENNKAVYAKVLGEMNGIRQNQGLDIRISNAAASTLGIADTEKFIVKVNY